MFQKNPQHPALLCEQDLKQDCVGAKRPPRNFKHLDLSPISAFWKDCSSAFHWCEEAVRVFWSNPSAPDCWTAAAPRTPKEFLGVQGVQTCNRCGRGCWPWWGLDFRLEAVENLGAILLFRTAPIERLCAMPMCHWREASKRKHQLLTFLQNYHAMFPSRTQNQSQILSIPIPGPPIVHHFGCSVRFLLLMQWFKFIIIIAVCMNSIIRCSTCRWHNSPAVLPLLLAHHCWMLALIADKF